MTSSKILRILKKIGLAPEIPEDLYHLIKKAVSMRKHLEANRKDRDGKFRLILVESRIHRLARYYKARQLWLCWAGLLYIYMCIWQCVTRYAWTTLASPSESGFSALS